MHMNLNRKRKQHVCPIRINHHHRRDTMSNSFQLFFFLRNFFLFFFQLHLLAHFQLLQLKIFAENLIYLYKVIKK